MIKEEKYDIVMYIYTYELKLFPKNNGKKMVNMEK